MTRPQDAPVVAALESQYRELTIVLGALESARTDLIPPPAGFWRGVARHAFDAAMDGLVTTMDAGIAAVRSARDRTGNAIAWMVSRG